MLKPAQLYKEELIPEFERTWYDDEYKYYMNDCYFQDLEILSDTVNLHQFVSVDSNEEIVGYIAYEIDRATDNVSNLCAINMKHNMFVFGMDLIQAIDDIFVKFNFSKIEFVVVVGNPAESMYDRFVRMCKGRIAGIYKKHVKLMDGQIYDVKMYEVMKENYLKNRHKFFR